MTGFRHINRKRFGTCLCGHAFQPVNRYFLAIDRDCDVHRTAFSGIGIQAHDGFKAAVFASQIVDQRGTGVRAKSLVERLDAEGAVESQRLPVNIAIGNQRPLQIAELFDGFLLGFQIRQVRRFPAMNVIVTSGAPHTKKWLTSKIGRIARNS